MNSENNTLLSIKGLKTEFRLKEGRVLRAVDGIDLDIKLGEIHGLVGESGCGKTVTSLSILRLIEPPGYLSGGEILWNSHDLLRLSNKAMRKIRGKEIALIVQSPQASLNPVYSIGEEMISVLRLHRSMTKSKAREEAKRLLNLVNVPDAEYRLNDFPHQLSVGLCQRVMIAMALSCRPKLLIGDEPTASLDVTIQAQILRLLLELRETFQMAILLVSHDLGVISKMCDRISVMYLGKIVETSDARKLYHSPMHPYTKALLQSIPSLDFSHEGPEIRIEGDLPSPIDLPPGCRFQKRCPESMKKCLNAPPQMRSIDGEGHYVACYLYE